MKKSVIITIAVVVLLILLGAGSYNSMVDKQEGVTKA